MKYFEGQPLFVEKKQQKIKQQGIDESSSSFLGVDFNTNSEIKNTNERVHKAYLNDGTIRNAIDRFIDTISEFKIKGDPKLIKYLDARLSVMGLTTGEAWDSLILRAWGEYWRVGNAFIQKYRGNSNLALRPLYQNKPRAIKGLILRGLKELNEHKTGENFKVLALQSSTYTELEDTKSKLDPAASYINDPKIKSNNHLLPGRDVIHIPYKKPADNESMWGISIGLTSIRAILHLRNLEEVTLVMIKKNLIPIIHHKVNGIGHKVNSEINMAERMHRESAPDKVIVTSGMHEITMHGGESLALRVSDYLDHYQGRAVSSVGGNLVELGLEKGNHNDVEGARELRLAKVNAAVVPFCKFIEMYLLWELLYEGGYNPYENPDHRVNLYPVYSEESVRIKRETHAVDLFTKGAIDQTELRSQIDWVQGPGKKDMYFYKLTDSGVPLKQPDTKTPVEEFTGIVDTLPLPSLQNINYYISSIHERTGIDLTPVKPTLKQYLEKYNLKEFRALVIQEGNKLNEF